MEGFCKSDECQRSASVEQSFSLMALKSISAVLYLTLVTTNPAIKALVNSTAGKEKLNLKF